MFEETLKIFIAQKDFQNDWYGDSEQELETAIEKFKSKLNSKKVSDITYGFAIETTDLAIQLGNKLAFLEKLINHDEIMNNEGMV